jgi:hypothetical protein
VVAQQERRAAEGKDFHPQTWLKGFAGAAMRDISHQLRITDAFQRVNPLADKKTSVKVPPPVYALLERMLRDDGCVEESSYLRQFVPSRHDGANVDDLHLADFYLVSCARVCVRVCVCSVLGLFMYGYITVPAN